MNKNLSSFIFWFFLFLIASNFVYVSSGAVHFPMSHIDVWSSWLYKAKALYLSGGSIEFLITAHNQFNHPQYPILLPLVFAFIYQILGGVNELAVSIVSPIIYVSVLYSAYLTLRKLKLSALAAVVLTYCYSMLSPLLAQGGRYHAGMPDIYLTLLHWLAVLTIYSSQNSLGRNLQKTTSLVLITIIASLIKTEGALFVFYFLFLPITARQKLLAGFVALLGFILWEWIVITAPIYQSYTLLFPTVSVLTERVPTILSEVITEVYFNLKNWYITWWLFSLLAFVPYQQSHFSKRVLSPLLLAFLGSFFFIYLCNTTPVEGYVSSSLDRLLLQISPIWFLLLSEQIMAIIPFDRLSLEHPYNLRYNHALFQKKIVSILTEYKEHHGSTSKEQNHPRRTRKTQSR